MNHPEKIFPDRTTTGENLRAKIKKTVSPHPEATGHAAHGTLPVGVARAVLRVRRSSFVVVVYSVVLHRGRGLG